MSSQFTLALTEMKHREQDGVWRVKFQMQASRIGSHVIEVSVEDRDPSPNGEDILRSPGDIAQRAERRVALDLGVLAGLASDRVEERFKSALTAEVRSALTAAIPDRGRAAAVHEPNE